MLLEVESVGQMLPATMEIFVEGTLFRFFGRKRVGGSDQFTIELQNQSQR